MNRICTAIAAAVLTASAYAGPGLPEFMPVWDHGQPIDFDPTSHAAILGITVHELQPGVWTIDIIDHQLWMEDEWTMAMVVLQRDGHTLLVVTAIDAWFVDAGRDIPGALADLALSFDWET